MGALVPTGGGPRTWTSAAEPVAALALHEDMDLDVVADKIIEALRATRSGTTDEPHPSAAAASEVLSAQIPGKLRLPDVARSVVVSQSSLSRLFTRETGTSFSASVRWARLILAFREFEDGASITDAAHAAGFTDSAHANRVCREMTGVSPTTIVRAIRGE